MSVSDVELRNPHKLLDGAAAGLIATVPMTLFMLACHTNLPTTQRYPLPPSLITKRMFGGIAVPGRPAPMPNWASTLAAHFGFGAGTGALFLTVPAQLRRQHSIATGIGYGLCVWTASYLGWVPAMGLVHGVAVLPHFDRMSSFVGSDVFRSIVRSAPAHVTVIGVDEDTALVKLHNAWQVMGRQTVTLFDREGNAQRYAGGATVPLQA